MPGHSDWSGLCDDEAQYPGLDAFFNLEVRRGAERAQRDKEESKRGRCRRQRPRLMPPGSGGGSGTRKGGVQNVPPCGMISTVAAQVRQDPMNPGVLETKRPAADVTP